MLSKNITYIDPVRRQVDNIFAAARTENGEVLLPHYYGESGREGWLVRISAGRVFPNRRAWESFRNDHRVVPLVAECRRPEANSSEPARSTFGAGVDRVPSGTQTELPVRGVAAGAAGCRANGRAHEQEGQWIWSRALSRSSRSQTSRLVRRTSTARETFFAARSGISIPTGAARASRKTLRHSSKKSSRQCDADPRQHQHAPRRLIVQMGVYGEHQAISVRQGDRNIAVNAPHFEVQLAAGAGETPRIGVKRLVNDPTLRFPWERRQSVASGSLMLRVDLPLA